MEQPNILIVDDNKFNRIVLNCLLKQIGFNKINEAEDGQTALDFIYRFSEMKVVVLLDLMMPIMNGYEFMNRIKNNPDKFRNVKILIQSGIGGSDLYKIKLDEQVVDFIEKPILLDVLREKMSQVLIFEQCD
jgi:CheY-like chemotaxis protein